MTIVARVMTSLCVGSWLLMANVVAAQNRLPSNSAEEVFTFFYKDPRPERLVGHFDEFRKILDFKCVTTPCQQELGV